MKTKTKAIGEAAELVLDSFSNWTKPEFFIQFGAGFNLDGLFDDEPQEIPLASLPGMPDYPNPDDLHPMILFGFANKIPILVAKGHRHLYEGLGAFPCVLLVCVAKQLGIDRHIFIEPALSLNNELKPGTWTLLTDFINGHVVSPLDGMHHILESPFPDMTEALSQFQNSELVNAFSGVGINVRLVVYMARPGSQVCTVAEAEAARRAGADTVGHDLIMEIIMAHALKCRVSSFALIADNAPLPTTRPTSRRKILETCAFCSRDFIRGLRLAFNEIIQNNEHNKITNHPIGNADEILANDFKRPTGKPMKFKLLNTTIPDDHA